MRVFFVFIYSFTTFITLTWTLQPKSNLRLIVSPIGHILVEDGPPVLVRKVDDFLNLTCRLVDDKHETLPNYNITWNWQYSTSSNANRVMMVSLSHNAANLVFKSLKETDSGEYTCKCSELDLYQNVWLKVKAFKRTCSDKMFVCANGNCIAKHYMCDGKVDCKGGVDEAFEHCGANPCEGKIPCEDGRCIPESWCCDEIHDPNCTTKYKPKCCQRYLMSLDPGHWDNPNRYGDLGFLQTTIYTVIGCAMAFMFIVTILVIAICRVHLKRTVISRCPLNHQHHHLRPGSPLRPGSLPLYDIDMFLDHRHQESHTGGLLVTYNINNGVQFVGRPIDPPPYCEIVDTPPREGPPPPYVSRENITQETALPVTTEGNHTTSQEEDAPKAADETIGAVDQPPEVIFTRVPNQVVSNLKGLTNKLRANEPVTSTHSMGDVSKLNQDNSSTSYDFCSSVPSVSGLSKIKNKNIKRNVLTDFSDSESDSSCMENDTLLNANIRKSCDNNSDDFRSKSVVLSNENSSNSFINNIAAVSKSLIGSLSKKTVAESELKAVKHRTVPNTARKPFKPLLTQKSFDSSDHTRKELVLSEGNNSNFDKIVPTVTHSLGDLSPISNDINYGDFSERRDFLTLPLRESFIGVRNEEM